MVECVICDPIGRYSPDTLFETKHWIAGVKFVDKEFGHNYARAIRSYKPERAVAEGLLRELRAK
jgi:hypothetical protein